MPPRLLIITAAFGEGHNSAARNLSLALDAAGAVTHTADPCLLGSPLVTEALRRGYRVVTTYFPRLWERIYRSTDQQDFRRQRLPLMRKPERYLARLLDDFQADAVVSTYPLYPYFLERIFEETGRRLPVFTAVTDSIEINAAWLKAPCDCWLVTDPATRQAMVGAGLPQERVVDSGQRLRVRLWFVASRAKTAAPHPDARPGQFLPRLWEYDVAELFLADPESGRYLEFNLAPNGAWWNAEFTAPRVRTDGANAQMPDVQTFAEQATDGSWAAALALPLDLLEARIGFGPHTRANVTFILESPAQRFLSANDLGGGEPDFHRPERFSTLQPTAIPAL